jgi:hypothetical protein
MHLTFVLVAAGILLCASNEHHNDTSTTASQLQHAAASRKASSTRKHSWSRLYLATGLGGEEEGMDVVLEAAALVIFSLLANLILFASCYSTSKHPAPQEKARKTCDEPGEKDSPQTDEEMPSAKNSLNQADRVIMKFMYGDGWEAPQGLPVQYSLLERQASVPVFGQTLQHDLDRQSMLLCLSRSCGYQRSVQCSRHSGSGRSRRVAQC